MTTANNEQFWETLSRGRLANVEVAGWVKCYAGAGSVVGSAGGPVGYWGGALVGYATFC